MSETPASDNSRVMYLLAGWMAPVAPLALLIAWTAHGMALGALAVVLILSFALAVAASVCLLVRSGSAAVVLWLLTLLLLAIALLMVLQSGVVDSDSTGAGAFVLGLGLFGALLAFIASIRIDPVAIAQQSAARQHEQRVAQIAAWEAAYRDAHNGEAPPAGFMPPVALAPNNSDRTNTMAILALVLGWFTGILGVVFGHIALNQIKRTGERGRGLAIAGLVLGYIALVVVLIVVSLWVVAINSVL